MKQFLHLFISLSIITSIAYTANRLDIDKLAYSKTWLGLLHYDPEGKESSILNRDFFLNTKGKTDPIAELEDTLNAYKKHNMAIICKYPARYFWLASQYDWKEYNQTESQCTSYNKWDLIGKTHAISIVFVSGFLGNPASAFGHSFIKLNKKEEDTDLLSNTISYGAKLPKKYTMLSYIYNGVIGGYEASYSDEYYYMNDMTYANQEFRQMWEYHLNLSPQQKRLLLLHLWELRGVYFRYYFFNRNCGYKVAELLDMVESESIRDRAYIWYAPIETFLTVNSYTKRVSGVQYVPSVQQSVYAFYKALSKQEKISVAKYINGDIHNVLLDTNMSRDSQIKILDFLLDFQTYKMSSLEKTSKVYREERRVKQKLLQQRFMLPASHYTKPSVAEKLPITDYNAPNRVVFSMFHTEGTEGAILKYSPFAMDATGLNIYEGDILKVLNSTFILTKEKINISALDLIQIRRLKTEALPFDIDNPLAWELHIGMTAAQKYDFFASGGVGYAWKIGKHTKIYTMIDFSIHTIHTKYRVNPYMGLLTDFGNIKMDIQYGLENSLSRNVKEKKFSIDAAYIIDKEKSLFFQAKKDELQTRSELGVRWYF